MSLPLLVQSIVRLRREKKSGIWEKKRSICGINSAKSAEFNGGFYNSHSAIDWRHQLQNKILGTIETELICLEKMKSSVASLCVWSVRILKVSFSNQYIWIWLKRIFASHNFILGNTEERRLSVSILFIFLCVCLGQEHFKS